MAQRKRAFHNKPTPQEVPVPSRRSQAIQSNPNRAREQYYYSYNPLTSSAIDNIDDLISLESQVPPPGLPTNFSIRCSGDEIFRDPVLKRAHFFQGESRSGRTTAALKYLSQCPPLKSVLYLGLNYPCLVQAKEILETVVLAKGLGDDPPTKTSFPGLISFLASSQTEIKEEIREPIKERKSSIEESKISWVIGKSNIQRPRIRDTHLLLSYRDVIHNVRPRFDIIVLDDVQEFLANLETWSEADQQRCRRQMIRYLVSRATTILVTDDREMFSSFDDAKKFLDGLCDPILAAIQWHCHCHSVDHSKPSPSVISNVSEMPLLKALQTLNFHLRGGLRVIVFSSDPHLEKVLTDLLSDIFPAGGYRIYSSNFSSQPIIPSDVKALVIPHSFIHGPFLAELKIPFHVVFDLFHTGSSAGTIITSPLRIRALTDESLEYYFDSKTKRVESKPSLPKIKKDCSHIPDLPGLDASDDDLRDWEGKYNFEGSEAPTKYITSYMAHYLLLVQLQNQLPRRKIDEKELALARDAGSKATPSQSALIWEANLLALIQPEFRERVTSEEMYMGGCSLLACRKISYELNWSLSELEDELVKLDERDEQEEREDKVGEGQKEGKASEEQEEEPDAIHTSLIWLLSAVQELYHALGIRDSNDRKTDIHVTAFIKHRDLIIDIYQRFRVFSDLPFSFPKTARKIIEMASAIVQLWSEQVFVAPIQFSKDRCQIIDPTVYYLRFRLPALERFMNLLIPIDKKQGIDAVLPLKKE
jgi:hypothetical protein